MGVGPPCAGLGRAEEEARAEVGAARRACDETEAQDLATSSYLATSSSCARSAAAS